MRYFVFIGFIFALACSTPKSIELTDYVNIFSGTTNSGLVPQVDPNQTNNYTAANVSPAAVLPWGMAAATPRNTMSEEWGPSLGRIAPGYYRGEPFFYGFGQTVLSGTGCHEMGHLLFQVITKHPLQNDIDQRKSKYSNETGYPGYYSVTLDNYNVKLEASATTRSTIYKTTFLEATDSAYFTFDLFHNIKPADSVYFDFIDDQTIQGWIANGGFCNSPNKQVVHFYIQTSKPAISRGSFTGTKTQYQNIRTEKAKLAYLAFNATQGEEIITRIGISYVSMKNAALNLKTEQANKSFAQIKNEAKNTWNKHLAKIEVEGGGIKNTKVFYTSLYRMLLHPNIFSDVNGEYRSPEKKKIKKLPSNRNAQYTTFSLWDTYRSIHPFLTLMFPEVQKEMLNTMVAHATETGALPKWELTGDELYVMIGDPGAIVIADSYIKGLKDFDTTAALEAMLRTANDTNNLLGIRPGNSQYIKYGFIPDDSRGDGAANWHATTTKEKVWGSVASSLEYYLADYAIAQMAQGMRQQDIANNFYNRSMGYKKLFDKETGFIRPKLEDGSWYEPFDPNTMFGEVPGATAWFCGGRGYCESNAWQYNFFVNHDVEAYAEMHGKENYVNKLQSAFEHRERFELFNEPDMSYPFLFNYIEGEEWHTQKNARWALEYYFDTTYAGIPGNDDCGTLSAWAAFTQMGFYPACPATNEYQLCSPVFDKITLHLDQNYWAGNKFEIIVNKESDNSLFIGSKKLNGGSFDTYSIKHSDITKGGILELDLRDTH